MSDSDGPKTPGFRRSSFCNGGDCVEVLLRPGEGASVRHSRSLKQESVTFSQDEWRDFVRGVKAGEFDPQ